MVDSIWGGAGNDTITNSGYVDSEINGGSGNDSITNNGGDPWSLVGGSGNDTITNNGSAWFILGENGNDSITNSGTIRYDISGGYGNDTITNNGTVEDIYGREGADSISNSGSVAGNIEGDSGNDTITLDRGTVTGNVDGGAHTDTLDLIVPDWAETLTYDGTPALGTLTYANGTTTETFDWTHFEVVNLTANAQANTITLLSGSSIDDVFALAGNDTIQWQGGTITGTLDAGAGTDTLDLTVPDWAETLTYGGTPTSGTLTYANESTTETFDWTDFEAVDLTANTLDNTIVLLGGSIIDDVSALAGNDTIQWHGGTITGTLDPGAGTDTLDLTVPDWARSLTYEGTPASGTLTYSGSGTTETFDWTDFEAVDLTANTLDNAIILDGDSIINDVFALGGNDTIQWQGGTITGTLDAGAGNDTLDMTVPDWAQTLTYEGTPSSGTLTYADTSTTETFDWTDFEAVDLTANTLDNTIVLLGGSSIDDVFALAGNDTIQWQGGTITGPSIPATGPTRWI